MLIFENRPPIVVTLPDPQPAPSLDAFLESAHQALAVQEAEQQVAAPEITPARYQAVDPLPVLDAPGAGAEYYGTDGALLPGIELLGYFGENQE